MRVTPREIHELTDRLLVRRRFPRGAIPAAATMVLAAECAGASGVGRLHAVLDRLDPGPWRRIHILEEPELALEACGASSLIVGPSLVELAATGSGRVTARGVGQPELLEMLPAYARCRAPTVHIEVTHDRDGVMVRSDGPAAPLRPPPGIEVDDGAWRELMTYANEVLASASAASRGDAG